MKPLTTIPDILMNLENSPKKEQAFAYWMDDSWSYTSTDEFIVGVKKLTVGLLELGLQKGDRVGIYAPSSPRWLMLDLAIASAGGITVPFFNNLSDEHFSFEVDQSRPKYFCPGNDENWERIKEHAAFFDKIIKIEKGAAFPSDTTIDDLLQKELKPGAYEKAIANIKSDDLATIIYTSGSTGMPKGVELTHKNLTAIIHEEYFQWQPQTERFLNFLPLSHIFSKQLNLIMVAWGIQSYYINDVTKIGVAAQDIKPTFIIAVPRLLEKVYAKMRAKIEDSSFFKRLLGKWALRVAFSGGGLLKYIFDPLVYKKLRAALGDNLRLVFCGGAALDPKLQKFFLTIGVPVYQGWGMTELSTLSTNRFGDNKIGTVGLPLGDAEFKISAEGELLVKGSTVMKGYYKNEMTTKHVFDDQGWFHTGDRGKIDKDGHLILEGRMNETFKTSQGEFVSPVSIEHSICQSPLIEIAMCVGESKPFVSCLLFPDWMHIQHLKKKSGSSSLSNEEFLRSPFICAEIDKVLKSVNAHLDHWEDVREWRLISRIPTVESGELTPTFKIRRKVILEKYNDLINEIYNEGSA